MDLITFDEFKKMDLRVGEILKAERVEGTDKLLKLEVDIGSETRQMVAGVADTYPPEELSGKKLVVIVNLKPAVIRDPGDPVLPVFQPARAVGAGGLKPRHMGLDVQKGRAVHHVHVQNMQPVSLHPVQAKNRKAHGVGPGRGPGGENTPGPVVQKRPHR